MFGYFEVSRTILADVHIVLQEKVRKMATHNIVQSGVS